MQIDVTEFGAKLKHIKRVVPEREINGFLQGVFIDGDTIQVNNSLLGLTAKLDDDTGERFFLPQRVIDTILQLPKGDLTLKANKGNKLTLKAEGIKSTYLTVDPDKFYPCKKATNGAKAMIESRDFLQALNFTYKAVAKNGINPAHLGVLMEVKDEKMTLVAIDGHRMQVAYIPHTMSIDSEGDFFTIIPRAACKQILAIGLKGDLKVETARGCANFITDDYIVTAKSCGGDFFNYSNVLILTGEPVKVQKSALEKAVTRARNCVDKDVKAPLKMDISDNVMSISILSTLGEYTEEIKVETQKDFEISIGFESSYLLEMLSTREEKELTFLFRTDVDPVIVEGEHFTSMVLPVRLKPVMSED